MGNRVVAGSLGFLLLVLSPATLHAAEARIAVVVVGGDDRSAGEAQREIESALVTSASVRAALLPSTELPPAVLVPEPAPAADEAFQKEIEAAKQAYFDDKLDPMEIALGQAEKSLAADSTAPAKSRWMLALWHVASSLAQSRNDAARTYAAAAAALSPAAVPVDTFPPAVAALVASERANLKRVPVTITSSSPRAATVTVDDAAVLPVLLEGQHWIRVAAERYRGYTTELTVRAAAPPPPLDLWLAPSIDPGLAAKAAAFARAESDGDAAAFATFAHALAPEMAAVVFAVPTATGWQARVWRVDGKAPSESTARVPDLGRAVLDALRRPVPVAAGGEPGGATPHAGGGEREASLGGVSAGLFVGGRIRTVAGLAKPLRFSAGGAQLGWDGDFGSVGLRARADIAQVGLFGDYTDINQPQTSAPPFRFHASAPFVRVALDGTDAFGGGFAGVRAAYESISKDAAPPTYQDASNVAHPANLFPKYSLIQVGPTGGAALPIGPARLRADAALLFGSYDEGGAHTATKSSTMATEAQVDLDASLPVGDSPWTILGGVSGGYRMLKFGGTSNVMLTGSGPGPSGVKIDETLVGGSITLSRHF